jgi:hypothetical protein
MPFLMLLALLQITPAWGKWEPFMSNVGDTFYVDQDSLVHLPHASRLWYMVDLKNPDSLGMGKPIFSYATLMEYDCTGGVGIRMSLTAYSGNMERGEILVSTSIPKTIRIEPHTIEEKIRDFACSSEATGNWTYLTRDVSGVSQEIYVDPITIGITPTGARMWTIRDLLAPVNGLPGVWSIVLLEEFNCAEGTSRALSKLGYSEHMGGGEVLYSATAGTATYFPPSSTEGKVKDYACSHLSLKQKAPPAPKTKPHSKKSPPATEL